MGYSTYSYLHYGILVNANELKAEISAPCENSKKIIECEYIDKEKKFCSECGKCINETVLECPEWFESLRYEYEGDEDNFGIFQLYSAESKIYIIGFKIAETDWKSDVDEINENFLECFKLFKNKLKKYNIDISEIPNNSPKVYLSTYHSY